MLKEDYVVEEGPDNFQIVDNSEEESPTLHTGFDWDLRIAELKTVSAEYNTSKLIEKVTDWKVGGQECKKPNFYNSRG